MLFNSLEFALFFVTIYVPYLLLGHRVQNILLLVASYVFYMAWDWRFVSLILLSTVVDYLCALAIGSHRQEHLRKAFLALSVGTNLAILGYFKYANFFADSFVEILGRLGMHLSHSSAQVILPIGISFYTFQTMSYTIDVYRKKMDPVTDYLSFSLFVCFFPQLVAGPIERASRLLPQIVSPRSISFDKISRGAALILYGLFLKVYAADNLALMADSVFARQSPESGLSALFAAYAFSFQIFCDFAGYSNMARGLASLMGFDIMINFHSPYCVSNPREFWHRWHISLSTWLRDYVYIPLGGNRGSRGRTLFNITFTMMLGGLWHGAGWTFVLWGLYHSALLVIHHVVDGIAPKGGKLILHPRIRYVMKCLVFFHLVTFGWVLFRSGSVGQFMEFAGAIFSDMSLPSAAASGETLLKLLMYATPVMLMQAGQYLKKDVLFFMKLPLYARTGLYLFMFYAIDVFGVNNAQSFIYFQF